MNTIIRSVLFFIIVTNFITAQASTLWWMGNFDSDWQNENNWAESGTHFPYLPENFPNKSYITTSDHNEMTGTQPHFLDNPLVILNDVSIAPDQKILNSPFYIGGWDIFDNLQQFDHDPTNQNIIHRHEGILQLERGEITLGVNPQSPSNPKCHYLRVGSYGARGTINQSGGKISSCTFMTFGHWSPDSLGTWNLSGGTIETYGFDLGNQGIGIFDMRGGTLISLRGNISVDPDGNIAESELPNAIPRSTDIETAAYWNEPDTNTIIGRGYNHSSSNPADNNGYLPGIGIFNQVDGVTDLNKLEISSGPASIGILAIRKNAKFTVNNQLTIGTYGKGSMIQTGGEVNAKGTISLGRYEGAFGELSLAGGTFKTKGPILNGAIENENSYSHNDWSGTGNITIIGSNTELIDIYGADNENSLVIYSGSRLSFLIDETTSRISTINANKQINFSDNAELDIAFITHGTQTGNITPGVNINNMPLEGENILLMQSNYRIVYPEKIKPTPRTKLNWRLKGEVTTGTWPTKIYAVYCPGNATAAECQSPDFYFSKQVQP